MNELINTTLEYNRRAGVGTGLQTLLDKGASKATMHGKDRVNVVGTVLEDMRRLVLLSFGVRFQHGSASIAILTPASIIGYKSPNDTTQKHSTESFLNCFELSNLFMI